MHLLPRKSIFLLAFAILSSMLIVSCNKKDKTVSPGGESVVIGDKVKVSYVLYEPDMTYRPNVEGDALSVVFTSSACNIEDLDKDVSSKVQITPKIDGSWSWRDDSVLVFQPAERWSLATKYKIKFQKDLFGANVIGPDEVSFTTDDFNIMCYGSEFYINPENANEKRATFTLSASHPVDHDSVEKAISLTFNEYASKNKSTPSSLGYTVTYDNNDKLVYIVSDVVKMPNFTSDVKLEYSGIKSVMGGTPCSKYSTTCSVPGMRDYVRINSVDFSLVKKDNLEYDQVLVINSKGKISPENILSRMEIYLLPKDKPAEQGWKGTTNCYWTNESSTAFTSLVKSQSTPVKAEIIPGALDYSEMNMFRIHVPQDKFIAVVFNGTLEFFGGYKLDKDDSVYYNRISRYPVEIGIVSEGALLALGGSKNIAMYSRGVNQVEYTVSRIMPKDINHLVSMTNGDMKNLSFDSYRFSEKNISETERSEYFVPGSSVERLSYFSYNFTKDLVADKKHNLENGLFMFQVTDKESRKSDRRFILVTDLGIVTKRNENSTTDIFVQSVTKGTPVSGAKVRVVGLNGNTIAETSTDSQGHAFLPKLDSKETSKDGHTPVAYIVEKGTDLSFMPYSSYGRNVDYSNFDVGGIYDSVSPDKIDAYVFSDRGMYRPGEKVNIGIIAKAGDWNKNLAGIPVEFKVKDSEGKDFFTKQFMLSSEGFEEVIFETRPYSPTGVYDVSFSLVKTRTNGTKYTEYLSGTSVKVEEYLPDTLNVTANFDPLPNAGWIGYDKDIKSVVKVKNLFGTPASGNEVKAQFTLRSGLPYMQKYREYVFHDPYSRNNTYDEKLQTTTTDESGTAVYDIDLSKFEKGSYCIDFYTEAFEKGSGRNVSARSTMYISPLDYVIGYKADGRLDFISRGNPRKMTFVAVNNNLESISLDNVTLKTEEIKYISTLVKQGNGLYKYQSVRKVIPVSEQKISIQKGGSEHLLPSDKSGEYRVTVIDKNGVEFNSFSYTVAGTADVTRSLTSTAELELNVENADFAPGEQAKIYIKAPYKGNGLITIEKDKVYAYKWFTQDSLTSVQSITIPKELEGNGYINVMFKRDYESDEIFMSPFCYGAVPFSVSREAKTQKINLSVPAEVKSGETLEIKYSTRDNAKIILYGVDEGIIQTAHYKTPDPLSHFFKKRALQVRTSQILDLILPEYNVLKTSMATGGGASMDEMLARRLNPFKRKVSDSVVFWSGVIPSGKDEQTYTYNVPDYFNGSIKVYAIAVNASSIGVEESRVTATNDFVIQPNSPLAVAPGDEFDLTVNVTNLYKGSKGKVTLQVVPDNHVEIAGSKTMDLDIPQGSDKTVSFRVKAKQSLGGAEIKFTATEKGTNISSKIVQTLSVRPNMPYRTIVSSGRFSGSKETASAGPKTYDEFAKRNVYASIVPSAFADGLNVYLADYPYGCSEQITSKAYPYVFNNFVAGAKSRQDCEKMINETIAILQSRQKSNNQIGYWTDKSSDDYFITLYVAEFLTDCQRYGYAVPAGFFESVIDAVRDIANSREDDMYNGIYFRSYATYILTKNDIITTNLIENIVSDAAKTKGSLDGYAGLYLAASYKMLKVDKEADRLLSKVNRTMFWSDSYKYHNSLQYSSLYVTIIAEYFPDKIKLLKKEMLDDMVEHMKYNNYNSYSVSSGLRAIAALDEVVSGDKDFVGAVEISGKNRKDITLSKDLSGKGTFGSNVDSIEFQKKAELPVYWMIVNSGYAYDDPKERENKGIEVYREILNTDGSAIKELKKGDEVLVRINYRTTTDSRLYNIAIVDMQSAFLEADIQSVRQSDGNRYMDYVDVREDRVVLYGSFAKDLRTFEYKARVINSGTFNVPPSYAESMYNPEIYSIAPSPKITVSE